MAEGDGLLNRYTVKSRIGGSNPPLSAIFNLRVAAPLATSRYDLRVELERMDFGDSNGTSRLCDQILSLCAGIEIPPKLFERFQILIFELFHSICGPAIQD